jgi:GT2 family glycosyltransferase
MQKNCEILVIDNHCTDHTAQVVEVFQNAYITRIVAADVGLSHARNVGVAAAQGTHIAFIDDDAYADENFVKTCIELTKNTEFACVGGIYKAWYKYGKPPWYHDNWVENKVFGTELCAMPPSCWAAGCVVLYDKAVVQKVGNFDVKLGMSGSKTAYGEETQLQYAMQKMGYKIGHCPQLIIYHLVPKYKLNVRWLLRSQWAKGASLWIVRSQRRTPLLLAKIFLSCVGRLFVDALGGLFKLAQPHYYIQNYALDAGMPLAFGLGRIFG